MTWPVWLLLGGATLLFIAAHIEDSGNDSAIVVVAGFSAVFLSLALLLVCWVQKATVSVDIARVQELRAMAAAVDLDASEDIAGKVADFNMELVGAQRYNRWWFFDPFIPDEWTAQRTIAVPMRGAK